MFSNSQSPECLPAWATLRHVVARWRQGFKAFENSERKGAVEISGGFEACSASRKRFGAEVFFVIRQAAEGAYDSCKGI